MDEILREFLLETHENLVQLDLDLVSLEQTPAEPELLARVFRTFHTVKGTAGFLGLVKLQQVTHVAENLLSRLRSRELTLNAEIATSLLSVVDAIRKMLNTIEAQGNEGSGDYTSLVKSLEKHLSGDQPAIVSPPPIIVTVPSPPKPEPTKSEPAKPVLAASVSMIAEAPDAVASAVSDSSIRVDTAVLDHLMNLVGELVLARNQVLQMSAAIGDDRFLDSVQRLNRLTTELQAGVMKTRMQPIGSVLGKFPRIVRDLAVACGKKVRLELEGQDTELDKSIIEAIRDPLTHMVRNAVDHGIEPPAERTARGKPAEGVLLLRALHEGGKVIIEIRDDGGGIDALRVRDKALAANLISPEQAARLSPREMLELIFRPGFSTTDRVTQFSGRGVGMDVVRTNIMKIGGTVDLESEPGRGTAVRLKIPLTLAIIPALIIGSCGERMAIPQVSLLELLRLERDQAEQKIERIHGVEVYRLRGKLLPLVRLDLVLGVPSLRDQNDVHIIVLQAEDRTFGLIVDEIHDTEEIVVKPLQRQLKGIAAFSGATLMGDGSVALILDVLGIAQRAGLTFRQQEQSANEKSKTSDETAGEPLLCCSIREGRIAMPLSSVTRLEEFPRSAVERSGGRSVVQYRGEIMPLIRVSRLLSGPRRKHRRTRRGKTKTNLIQVVVVAGEGRLVGLVIDRILDIVPGGAIVRTAATRHGVLYCAVVQDRVTEILDLEHILQQAGGRRG
ncbi:N/A [soil metagenome]